MATGYFPGGQSGRRMKLAPHVQLYLHSYVENTDIFTFNCYFSIQVVLMQVHQALGL
jgi:hypothetical protein